MKTRIVLTILLIVAIGWFSRSIGEPVTTVARNTAAVASVNGGDVAYVAQNTVDTTSNLPYAITAGIFGVLFIWAGPIRSAFKAQEQKS